MQWRQGPAALASNIMVGTDGVGVGVGRRFDSETPQGLAVLTERPNMGMNDSEVLDPGAGHSRKTVVHLLEVLAGDLQGREWHPVVDLGDRLSRRRSFRSAAWPSACRPPPLPGRHPRRRRTAGPSRTEMSQGTQAASRHRACPGRRWCCYGTSRCLGSGCVRNEAVCMRRATMRVQAPPGTGERDVPSKGHSGCGSRFRRPVR